MEESVKNLWLDKIKSKKVAVMNSHYAPSNHNCVWLKDGIMYIYGNAGWEELASSGGGSSMFGDVELPVLNFEFQVPEENPGGFDPPVANMEGFAKELGKKKEGTKAAHGPLYEANVTGCYIKPKMTYVFFEEDEGGGGGGGIRAAGQPVLLYPTIVAREEFQDIDDGGGRKLDSSTIVYFIKSLCHSDEELNDMGDGISALVPLSFNINPFINMAQMRLVDATPLNAQWELGGASISAATLDEVLFRKVLKSQGTPEEEIEAQVNMFRSYMGLGNSNSVDKISIQFDNYTFYGQYTSDTPVSAMPKVKLVWAGFTMIGGGTPDYYEGLPKQWTDEITAILKNEMPNGVIRSYSSGGTVDPQ